MKKILFLGFILFIFPITKIYASSIYSIDMDIYVSLDGSATIKEVWDANVTEGTEGWHPYYNLGNSKISDVNVSMDGKYYTTVYDWNINNSFSDKAYKASLYYADEDEVDVVFGISNYGHHIYSISYKISNFVSTVDDADIIYWNLFPYDFSAEPDNVSITIYSDFNYEDNWDVWGYGKYGAPCYIFDGKIEMTSDGVISSDEYLTILAKFPKGTFNASNVLDNDFNYYYDMAEEGAINYNVKNKSFFVKAFEVLVGVISMLFPILLFVIIFLVISVNSVRYRYGNAGNKVRKDVPYFRDIPCNNNIYRAYWVAIQYNLISKKEDLMGSILLKWLKDGNVRVEKVEKTGVFKNKTESNIIFVSEPDSIELEKNLYNWMMEASVDGKLESNEFKKWCDKNYSKVFKWFDDIISFEEKMLMNENKIREVKEKKFKFLTYTYRDVDDSMMIEAEQMAGLKKFLKDFTLIKEREPIEVHLWNEYLIYAQIFGVADKVAEQFKKLYPEIIQDMDSIGIGFDDIIFINMISHTGMVSASDARSRAASYNSGGGGFSSGGGGGGSFGGGGGGGGFR